MSGGHGQAVSTACDGGACEFSGRFSVAIRPLLYRQRTAADGTLMLHFPSGEQNADGTVKVDLKSAQAELCAKFGNNPRRCTALKVTRARVKVAGGEVELHALLNDERDGKIEAHLVASALGAVTEPVRPQPPSSK